jgi:RNA polymerase sigma-70 factor (ECF subfamily)
MTERDLTLVTAAQKGDRNAFQRLLSDNYTMMYRVAYRFTGHAQDAEDIAQDICMQMAHKLGSFKGESSFSTWLYRVVVNACRDFHKTRKVRRDLAQTYLETEKREMADSQDSCRKVTWLYRKIAELEDTLRETALLVLAEELSHAEAAKILRCAESTVSWRMHEVRKILKQLVNTYP